MKRKIFVAIPTIGSVADSQVHFLREIEKRYGEQVELIYPKECVRRMFHDYARNAMVEEFLETDAEAIWFLDSDITPPKHVLDLVTLHWDRWSLSGAPYPIFISLEGSKPQVVFAVFNGTDGKGLCPSKVPYAGTEFVDGLATGCIFIKRVVLENMSKPYFAFRYDEETRKIEEGEDLGFCRRVNALGHRFFIDYSMTCKHYKSVCLLDVNNYAIEYANKSVLAYDGAIRGDVERLAKQVIASSQAKKSITLPGTGSPFARGK